MAGAFADDALLLIGHGSARYPDAGRALFAHADQLRREFADVGVGFLNGAPSAAEALARLRSSVVYVVPFFMENGYFARVAVPKALIAAGERSLRFCPAIGTHAGMAALIEAHILQSCTDPEAVAVVLVGHGSTRAPGRAMGLHRQAERLRAGGRFASVDVAFLEESPFVPDVLAAARGSAVAVVAAFAGQGMHVRDDLPGMIDAEHAHGRDRVRYLGSVSGDPAIAALILDQVARTARQAT